MNAKLNKWVRKFHRWFAYPFILLILLLIFLRQSATGEVLMRIQQGMVLVMALTGGYLLLLPYIMKRKRSNRN
jgi:hypothetical protein